jgi:hypothetical protein
LLSDLVGVLNVSCDFYLKTDTFVILNDNGPQGAVVGTENRVQRS